MQRPFFFVARLGDEKHYINLEHIVHVAIKAEDSAFVTVEGIATPLQLLGKDLKALVTLLDRFTDPDDLFESQESAKNHEARKGLASRKNLKSHQTKAVKTTGDPRSSHPAIQAVKAALGRYPQKVLYDKIIEAVGDKPNVDLMIECATEYASRGKYTGDLSIWLFDWYVGNQGVPSKQMEQADNDGWQPAELTPEIIMASEGVSREEAIQILDRLHN